MSISGIKFEDLQHENWNPADLPQWTLATYRCQAGATKNRVRIGKMISGEKSSGAFGKTISGETSRTIPLHMILTVSRTIPTPFATTAIKRATFPQIAQREKAKERMAKAKERVAKVILERVMVHTSPSEDGT